MSGAVPLLHPHASTEWTVIIRTVDVERITCVWCLQTQSCCALMEIATEVCLGT